MKQHIIFMNGGLTPNFTGIESSAFKRYKLFTQHLNRRPIYLSLYEDWELPQHTKALQDSGHIPEDFNQVNLFEFFLSDADTKRSLRPRTDLNMPTQLLTNQGQKRVARVYNQTTGLLSFVNFYDAAGKRYRMDSYDRDGYLMRTVNFRLDTETLYRQSVNFYRQDGSLAISSYYDLDKSGKNKLTHSIIFDKDGTPNHSFITEDDLYIYLLRYYLNHQFSHQDQVILFIDRHVRLAKHLTNGSIAPKLNCLHVLHNDHLVDHADRTSDLSSAYSYLNDLEHFGGVVTLTPQQTQDIKDRFGDYGNVHCIPHPIDQLPKPVSHNQRQPLRVIAVGRLHHQKQHDKMIRIFAKVVKEIPDAQLDIFGKGSLEGKLKEQIAQLGLDNNVHLKGFSTDIAKEFETAQCSLLTSKYEGQPLVVLESLSYGCPVISSDIAYGPASMIEDGQNGFLLPADDDELFAQRIIQVLQDKNLSQSLSAQAYQTSQNFSPETIAPLWQELIDQLTE